MDQAKVMEVLRQVEFVGGGPPPAGPGQCPLCGGWQSDWGHLPDCKLAALLSEAEKEQPSLTTYPIMICSVCKRLEGSCECTGVTIRWRIFQPEYYQSVLRTCGGAEQLGEERVLPTIDLTPRHTSEALAYSPIAIDGQGTVDVPDLLKLFRLFGVPEDGGLYACDPVDPDQRFVIRRVERTQGETGGRESSE